MTTHTLQASHNVTTPITVAQLILKYLELEGVDHLFGIPGGATMFLSAELKKQRDKFRFVVCRQETGATYIADGYQRISGNPGVVMVTAGPGACNALTGAMNAQASGSRVLLLTGEVPEQYYGMGYLQEGVDASLDVQGVYRNAVGFSEILSNASSAQTLVEQALRAVMADPPGVAHLSMPDDVIGSEVTKTNPETKKIEGCSCSNPCSFPDEPAGYRAVGPHTRPRNDKAIEEAFEILLQAERPLLFVGNGCRRALQGGSLDALTTLVEKLGIPVMTTPQGKGLFPESHDLALRNWGIAYCEWPQFYMGPSCDGHFDALCILASSLGELATVKWNPLVVPDGKVIQVDIDPAALGRVYPLDLGIVADVGSSIDHLGALALSANPDPVGVGARRAAVAAIKSGRSPYASPAKYDSDQTPILPQRVMKSIQDHLPTDAHIFVDSGNCYGWAAHYLVVDPPMTFNIALNMGPMGVAVGAVVGGKFAAPDKTCIAIVGDGAFMMQGSEVATAAAHDVGAIWIVLSDDDLGMVSQGMDVFFPDPGTPPPAYPKSSWDHYYSLGTPDLAMYAEGLGAKGYTATTPAELDRYIKKAIIAAKKDAVPQVVVVKIDGSEIPPYYQQPQVT
jgi:acetolactate synthase-1/2/3 large subunit